jgi:hypothetical protein
MTHLLTKDKLTTIIIAFLAIVMYNTYSGTAYFIF